MISVTNGVFYLARIIHTSFYCELSRLKTYRLLLMLVQISGYGGTYTILLSVLCVVVSLFSDIKSRVSPS